MSAGTFSRSGIAPELLREEQIQRGTVWLTAEEIAPRIGRKATKAGLRGICKDADMGVLPAVMDNGRWKFHWPTVVAKKFPQARTERRAA